MGEAQVLGADAGARVRGAWRRPGLGVWGLGRVEAAPGVQGLGVWKPGGSDIWGRGRVLQKCCVGRGLA